MSDSSKPPRRGARRRILIAGSVLLATAVVVAVLAGWFVARPEHAPGIGNPDVEDVSLLESGESVDEIGAQHEVYPYSIVPGGVHSVQELKAAIAADPVVAAHYTHISVPDTRVERVKAARQVYMSYRVGDKIYWTKRRVALSAGEAIVTDGKSLIRARCGNCISETPMQPTQQAEPAPSEFDRVIAPPLQQAEALPADFDGGIAPPLANFDGAAGGPDPASDGLWTGFLPLAAIAGGFGGSSAPGPQASHHAIARDSSSDPPTESLVPPPTSFEDPPVTGDPEDPPSDIPPVIPPGDPGPQQPVPVPEPGSMILVGTGLASYALTRLRRRKP
ncbi:MAG TPA: PEP-CTERM sorting domain-containing protein [Vicinamibacterales bacterium]|nr:PEP-CTERM sorting domain-containing protein [Vicinamibacterales bacterium]